MMMTTKDDATQQHTIVCVCIYCAALSRIGVVES